MAAAVAGASRSAWVRYGFVARALKPAVGALREFIEGRNGARMEGGGVRACAWKPSSLSFFGKMCAATDDERTECFGVHRSAERLKDLPSVPRSPDPTEPVRRAARGVGASLHDCDGHATDACAYACRAGEDEIRGLASAVDELGRVAKAEGVTLPVVAPRF